MGTLDFTPVRIALAVAEAWRGRCRPLEDGLRGRVVAPGMAQKRPVHALILRACRAGGVRMRLLVSCVGPKMARPTDAAEGAITPGASGWHRCAAHGDGFGHASNGCETYENRSGTRLVSGLVIGSCRNCYPGGLTVRGAVAQTSRIARTSRIIPLEITLFLVILLSWPELAASSHRGLSPPIRIDRRYGLRPIRHRMSHAVRCEPGRIGDTYRVRAQIGGSQFHEMDYSAGNSLVMNACRGRLHDAPALRGDWARRQSRRLGVPAQRRSPRARRFGIRS